MLGEQLYQEHILPKIHLHLRTQVSLLRRCKKPRMRKDRERKIGQIVTTVIETEAELVSQQTRMQHLPRLYNTHSKIHARLEYRYSLQQMRHKLPQELRDMAYSHIIGHRSVLVMPPSAPQKSLVELPTHPTYSAAFAPDPSPVCWLDEEAIATKHAFRSDTLGYENCREFVEIWYKKSVFIFDDVSILTQFLDADPWYFGICPRDLVRLVTLRIPEAYIRQPLINHPLYIHSLFYWLDLYPFPNQDDATLPLVDKLAHMRPFTNLTTILLHVVTGIDLDHNGRIVRGRPVEYWEKSNPSVELLLDGLNYIYAVLTKIQRDGQNVDICLESKGECVITKQNAVWSPLGWLERTITWGLERQ
jgi:hypothetical protein